MSTFYFFFLSVNINWLPAIKRFIVKLFQFQNIDWFVSIKTFFFFLILILLTFVLILSWSSVWSRNLWSLKAAQNFGRRVFQNLTKMSKIHAKMWEETLRHSCRRKIRAKFLNFSPLNLWISYLFSGTSRGFCLVLNIGFCFSEFQNFPVASELQIQNCPW